jgi:hypothetical protein
MPIIRRRLQVRVPSRFAPGLVALLLLAGCGGSPAEAPMQAPEVDEFSAELVGPRGTERISGSVELVQSATGADFTGAFQAYPVATLPDGRVFTFTMITLRSGTGSELILGHVSPSTALPDGRFGIEAGRDLRPPYGFVARLRQRAVGGPVMVAADGGTVGVTARDGRLTGQFDLRLADGRTLRGSFAAAARR